MFRLEAKSNTSIVVVIQSHQLIPETVSSSTKLSRSFWSPTENFQLCSTIIILQFPPKS